MLTHSFFWIYIAFFQIVSKAQKKDIYRIFSGYMEHFFSQSKTGFDSVDTKLPADSDVKRFNKIVAHDSAFFRSYENLYM